MPTTQPDLRSERRKALDEQLASEPHLPHPDVRPGEQPRPLEELIRHRRPWRWSGWWKTGWCVCSTHA